MEILEVNLSLIGKCESFLHKICVLRKLLNDLLLITDKMFLLMVVYLTYNSLSPPFRTAGRESQGMSLLSRFVTPDGVHKDKHG
jgi:hypothetical protein